MASAVQDVPDQEFNGIRYTGFPEPLSLQRNTTLPHPSANLSPDACIESSDIPLHRSHSFLRFSSSRRVSSKGFIDPNQVYENMLYVDSTVGSKPGSSSSSKQSSSPSLDDDARLKSSDGRRSSGETDSSERNHRKKKGLRGLFHKG
ncbi:hypothetical protein O988_02737 [Pseudogymnoascus sp. VKM F-3808]|nr:hypothetical protein V490_06788 [Pseudogymnoascus sp. VKM F-3557]KFY01465.1 hypothetical protein O988_02737 [Pseudogymnoascus sp. VKM F-3808]